MNGKKSQFHEGTDDEVCPQSGLEPLAILIGRNLPDQPSHPAVTSCMTYDGYFALSPPIERHLAHALDVLKEAVTTYGIDQADDELFVLVVESEQ